MLHAESIERIRFYQGKEYIGTYSFLPELFKTWLFLGAAIGEDRSPISSIVCAYYKSLYGDFILMELILHVKDQQRKGTNGAFDFGHSYLHFEWQNN